MRDVFMSVRYKIPQILRRYFVPQQDDFSCAVASMATISQICSKEYDYDYWLNLLNPSPETGTSQIKLEETVGVLGVCKAGCFIYEDGLAIANITMMPDNEGHYVVITSYSIHYTKLYESIKGFYNCFYRLF